MLNRLLVVMIVVFVLLPLGLWGGMALWARLPFGDGARALLVAAFVAALVASLMLLWSHRAGAGLALAAAATALLLGWWATIAPSNQRDWQPDVARVATAQIDGDTLTVQNVRNFNWRSDDDFDARWETRHYQLSQLRGADLFLSYWAGESVAHAIISFDFADSPPLAFSIEIRKEVGEAYSASAGFFKSYELAIIAADENDVVKVRSAVRGEDVRIYRLDIRRETALGLLKEYVVLANDVAAQPRWYNTLTANCTTMIFGMARQLDSSVSLDWRILLPGKLPAYLREHQFVSRAVPLAELTRHAHIAARVPGADADFSARIRAGVPVPPKAGQ